MTLNATKYRAFAAAMKNKLSAQVTLAALQKSVEATHVREAAIEADAAYDAPLVRYIDKVIADAIERKVSDIHFEPYDNYCRIRYRCDGVLSEVTTAAPHLAARIAARLKVMANMNISEKRIPQDGRFKLTFDKAHTISFRVNTCPTLFGEKIVLRILDPQAAQRNIDQLGFTQEQVQQFQNALQQTQGMILVTGPTGSGKTVTLYSGLAQLNTKAVNIATVEDPVEIYFPGINQVNVNPKNGLDFATALRAFLRQDPDIIMLGEIRDSETAETAIQAAQTGHLVLSTLHTNSAAATLTRLIHLGLKPFAIASVVLVVIAQRLVRCLCEQCKQPFACSITELNTLSINPAELSNATLFQAIGCNACIDGYSGRIGIYEVLPITEKINTLILQNASTLELHAAAIDNGMLTLRQAALQNAAAGITTLTEILPLLT